MVSLKRIVLQFSTLVAIAQAQSPSLFFSSSISAVTAGLPVTLTYNSTNITQPATITLRKGIPDNLDSISVLTNNATGGNFLWIPQYNLDAAADYVLQITQGDQINRTAEFAVNGGLPAAISAASVASASAASSLSFYYRSALESASVASLLSGLGSIPSIISAINASVTNTATITTISYNVSTLSLVSISFGGASTASGSVPTGPILRATGTPTLHPQTLTTTVIVAASSSASVVTTSMVVSPSTITLGSTGTSSVVGGVLDSSLALAFGIVVAVAFLG